MMEFLQKLAMGYIAALNRMSLPIMTLKLTGLADSALFKFDEIIIWPR
jgi:hypothetical protein